ncbi:MAG: PA2778 family cysteine peptidase [Woeseiaceae bacterium]|nr:PA2778 family cysteine peptidase [Woeseiaceae bacterium]
MLDEGAEPQELVDTPFFPQERYQCGPAALATVLSSSGVPVEPDDLVDRVYLPGRQGSLQVEMLAATRMSGRIPYRVDGRLQAVSNELAAGRPVVILQNLGIAALPKWHFAVIVGIDIARDEIALRSGVDKRRVTSIPTFLRTWRRSDYWGFVALRPDALPADVDRERYVSAVAALQKAGRREEAATAWKTALDVWPRDPVAQFGLGNIELAAGNYAAAEEHFRAIIEVDSASVAARNNLAIALARQGRFAEAKREISKALGDNSDPALEDELLDTKKRIVDMSQTAAAQE